MQIAKVIQNDHHSQAQQDYKICYFFSNIFLWSYIHALSGVLYTNEEENGPEL